jgi:integrase
MWQRLNFRPLPQGQGSSSVRSLRLPGNITNSVSLPSASTSTIGTPIGGRKILREFDALVAAAKLPKQRFHDLRHACIPLLGAQGVPLKVISEIVGHSDIRLTQNVYQPAAKMDQLPTRVATETSVAAKTAAGSVR